jgi:hypothetical protein
MILAPSEPPFVHILIHSLLTASAVLAFTPADAGIFKCAGAEGAVVYQDSACSEGRELRNFDIDPPTLSIVPGTSTGKSASVGASDAPSKTSSSKARATHEKSKAGHTAAASEPDGAKAAERKFIRIGMSEAEVIQKIGHPNVGSTAQNRRGKQWSYLPAKDDPNTITTITLVGGNVTDVQRKLVR